MNKLACRTATGRAIIAQHTRQSNELNTVEDAVVEAVRAMIRIIIVSLVEVLK